MSVHRRDRCACTVLPLLFGSFVCSRFPSFLPLFSRIGVSLHRRDRCANTPFSSLVRSRLLFCSPPHSNEDSDMLPCKPDPPPTPDCKGTQASPNLTSGQKGPLPTSKLSREKQLVSPPDKALPGAVALPLSPQVQPGNIPCPCPVGPLREPPLLSPDPISPISLGAGNGLDKPQPSSGDSNHDDPITVTPPSQRDYPDNRVSPSTATRHHEQAPPEGQAAKGVNGQAIAPHLTVQSAILQNQHGSQL